MITLPINILAHNFFSTLPIHTMGSVLDLTPFTKKKVGTTHINMKAHRELKFGTYAN